MKRFLMALAVACVLSAPTLAGEIPTAGIVQPPPPPGESQTTSSTSPGDIPTGGLAGEIPSSGFAQQAEDAMLGGFLAVVGWLA